LITNHQRLPLGALGKGGHEIGLARLVPVAQTTRRQQIFCGNLTARRNQRMMMESAQGRRPRAVLVTPHAV
jgi:hypothetical protein